MNLRQQYKDWREASRAIITQLSAVFVDTRLALGIDTTDDLIVTVTTKGLVLRSPNGKYWRATISDAGVVTWADLGLTKP